MSLDAISIGTHGRLRSTGDILPIAVGSWGKLSNLPPEFVVGIRELEYSSQVVTTFDAESLVFQTKEFSSEINVAPEFESLIVMNPEIDSKLEN